jgi:hypothetical protein
MTVEELIGRLETMNSDLVVRLWDAKERRFTEEFSLTPSASDDELLIVPAPFGRSHPTMPSGKLHPPLPKGAGPSK